MLDLGAFAATLFHPGSAATVAQIVFAASPSPDIATNVAHHGSVTNAAHLELATTTARLGPATTIAPLGFATSVAHVESATNLDHPGSETATEFSFFGWLAANGQVPVHMSPQVKGNRVRRHQNQISR